MSMGRVHNVVYAAESARFVWLGLAVDLITLFITPCTVLSRARVPQLIWLHATNGGNNATDRSEIFTIQLHMSRR